MPPPAWRDTADAWFKLLGAVALAYLILAQTVTVLRDFGEISFIAVGGLLLAYFVFPLVHWLNARLPLWLALTIAYAGLAALTALALFLVVPPVGEELQALIRAAPEAQHRITATLRDPNAPFFWRLSPAVRSYLIKLPDETFAWMRDNVATVTSSVTLAFFSAVSIGAIVVAIPVVSIYMLAESPMMKRYVTERIPPRYRTTSLNFLSELDAVIGGFVRGQILVAACVALLALVPLLLLHVPYAFLIAAWAGISDILPYVGPFAGGIPAVLIALFAHGWANALLVALAFSAINQIEAHLLAPRIIGNTVRITPLVVIFALLIGASLFGFAGLIVAVPVAGAIRVALDFALDARRLRNRDIRPGLTQAPRSEVDPNATHA
jgi:predicted PurR-regulated permease PerM